MEEIETKGKYTVILYFRIDVSVLSMQVYTFFKTNALLTLFIHLKLYPKALTGIKARLKFEMGNDPLVSCQGSYGFIALDPGLKYMKTNPVSYRNIPFIWVVLCLVRCTGIWAQSDPGVREGIPTGQITFMSMRDGNFEIFRMAATGEDVTNLCRNPAHDYGASYTYTAQDLYFYSKRDGRDQLYRVENGSHTPEVMDQPMTYGSSSLKAVIK
jgi:hypothetical protein